MLTRLGDRGVLAERAGKVATEAPHRQHRRTRMEPRERLLLDRVEREGGGKAVVEGNDLPVARDARATPSHRPLGKRAAMGADAADRTSAPRLPGIGLRRHAAWPPANAIRALPLHLPALEPRRCSRGATENLLRAGSALIHGGPPLPGCAARRGNARARYRVRPSRSPPSVWRSRPDARPCPPLRGWEGAARGAIPWKR